MAENMTDEKIERYLKHAIEESTPDILDELMAEIEQEQAVAKQEPAAAEKELTAAVEFAGAGEEAAAEPEVEISGLGQALAASEAAAARQIAASRRKRRRWYQAFAACAAAVMIFTGAFTMFNKSQNDVFAVVNIDVNPSVELSINKKQEVVEARALNEDGTAILDGMDLAGTDVKVACNALIGSMVRQGYLSELTNSVLVSVRSEDKAGGQEIEHMISSDLNDSIGDSEVIGAVLGQYVGDDQELEAFASENGISPGKAWLIKNLLATGSKHMTEEALLSLPTQELILLSQERGVKTDDSYGSANTSKYISEDEAKTIALQKAGRTDLQLDAVRAEFDCDDGIITYEVEFTAGGREYEYDINAETGEILESEDDVDDEADGDDDDDDADDRDDDDRDDVDDDGHDDDHDNDDDDNGHDDDHDDDDDDHDDDHDDDDDDDD